MSDSSDALALAEEMYQLQQGTDQWAQARCGKVTASRVADLRTPAKREHYTGELIAEILTKIPYPHFVSREMQWGREQERFARAAYEMEREAMVETCGFVLHPDVDRFGCSPDGLVGDDGLIQIKCPTTMTHLEWMFAKSVPSKHMPQMLAELACTGRQWCDFVSFDPRLPAHLQLFTKRYFRDEKAVATLEGEVEHFNQEVADLLLDLPGTPQPIAKVLEFPMPDEVEF